jgi:hypothetical protein
MRSVAADLRDWLRGPTVRPVGWSRMRAVPTMTLIRRTERSRSTQRCWMTSSRASVECRRSSRPSPSGSTSALRSRSLRVDAGEPSRVAHVS